MKSDVLRRHILDISRCLHIHAAILMLPLVATAEEQAAVNLAEILEKGPELHSLGTTRLSPEWIGTIEEEGEPPKHLRLSHVSKRFEWLGKADDRIWIARVSSRGSWVGSDSAFYRESLPACSEIVKAQTLGQLKKLLGPGENNGLGGWGGFGESHDVLYWSLFTRAEEGRLRWLHVLAHLTMKEDEKNADLARVDKLSIAEGILRPADPNSAEEKKIYKSADELQAEDEKAKEVERAKLPEPLRALVAADQLPHDSDLKGYGAALSNIRRDPRPELFKQIAALDDSRTGQSYLEDILVDGIPPVEKWAPEKRSLAIRYALDALGDSHDQFKLKSQMVTLLQAIGGGHVEIDSPGIDLEVRGGSMAYSTWDVEEDNLKEAVEALKAWFEARLAKQDSGK